MLEAQRDPPTVLKHVEKPGAIVDVGQPPKQLRLPAEVFRCSFVELLAHCLYEHPATVGGCQ